MTTSNFELGQFSQEKRLKNDPFAPMMKTKLNIVSPTEKEIIASPKRVKIKENVVPTVLKEPPSVGNIMCSDLLLRLVLPFVGKNQYRFVGAVNHNFRTLYKELFSTTTTYHHVTTAEQASICYRDIEDLTLSHIKALCKVMVQQNNRTVLNFLGNYYIRNNAVSSTTAVKEGNLDLLKWLIRRKFAADRTAISSAAAYTDLTMIKFLRSLYNCPWDKHSVPQLRCMDI